MVALKVEQVGDSVAVLLPQDTLAALHVTPGDTLYLTEATDGYRVTPFDPELERRMAIARDIMAEDRNFLRELAPFLVSRPGSSHTLREAAFAPS